MRPASRAMLIAVLLGLFVPLAMAGEGRANPLTPDQLTQATTANNTDLMVIYPPGGPLKGVQWGTLKTLMTTQLGNSYLQNANNLSDMISASAARANLGLGTAATQSTGTIGSVIPTLSGLNTWSAEQLFASSTSAGAAINIGSGVIPTSPNGGDLWATASALYTQIGGHAYNLTSPMRQSAANAAFGHYKFGDSITLGVGCTPFPACGYAQLIDIDLGIPAANNYGVGGNYASDVAYSVFTNLNPQDTSNPIVTMMVGTNDAIAGVSATQQTIFQQFEAAAAVRASSSSTNTLAGNSSLLTQTGTWTTDTTFPNLTGATSTTNGSTLTNSAVNVPQGVIYVFYRVMNTGGAASGGSFNFSIDGAPATDTITGNSTLTTLPIAGATFSTQGGLTSAPAVARFVTTSGSHAISAAVTSATNAGNPVNILGIVIPSGQVGGSTGPRIAIGGTPRQNNDASATATATMNTLSQALATTLAADGLDVRFANVRAYLNATTDMQAATNSLNICGSGANVGPHPGCSGHIHLKQAFEDALGVVNAPITQAVNVTNIPAPTLLDAGVNGSAAMDAGTTNVPRGTWLVSDFGNFPWGLTVATINSQVTTLLTAGNFSGNGCGGIRFVPTHATQAQVVAGTGPIWCNNGTASLSPGVSIGANQNISALYTAAPSSVSGYHSMGGIGAVTTTLLGGVNVGSGTNFGGVQWLYDTALATYAFGVFAPSNELNCSWFFTNGTTPTGPSGFTCPDYTDSSGNRHSNSLAAAATTASSSTSTGAIIDAGGLGVAGAANIGGPINSASTITGTAITGTALTGSSVVDTGATSCPVANTNSGGTLGCLALATAAQVQAGTDSTHPVTAASLAAGTNNAATGHVIMPGGVIIEWGSFSVTENSSGTGSFDTACTSGVYSITGSTTGASTSNGIFWIKASGLSGYSWGWPSTGASSAFSANYEVVCK